MQTIEIDFDVFKAITSRRAAESETENDVLREVLGLPPARAEASPASAGGVGVSETWVYKNVSFPVGTELRKTFKGTVCEARVISGGILAGGKTYGSPSSAAMAFTGRNANGWTFWECRLPGHNRWKPLESLRK